MKVNIKKLSKNTNVWVDGLGIKDGIIGWIKNAPSVGDSMLIFCEDNNDHAMLRTTPIKTIKYDENKWTVTTKNSEYEVNKLSD